MNSHIDELVARISLRQEEIDDEYLEARQYGGPIKHARRVVAAHDRYPWFLARGEAEACRLGLERLRRQYGGMPAVTAGEKTAARD